MSGRHAWWPLRKARRLFFEDWRLSVPTVVWLAASVLLPRLGLSSLWQGIALFAGFAAILLGASLAAARDAGTSRDATPSGRPRPTARRTRA